MVFNCTFNTKGQKGDDESMQSKLLCSCKADAKKKYYANKVT